MPDRYTEKGEFQPGSNDQVLRNTPGITDAEEMDDLELELLDKLYDVIFDAGMSQDYEPMKAFVRRALLDGERGVNE